MFYISCVSKGSNSYVFFLFNVSLLIVYFYCGGRFRDSGVFSLTSYFRFCVSIWFICRRLARALIFPNKPFSHDVRAGGVYVGVEVVGGACVFGVSVSLVASQCERVTFQ